MRSSRRRAEALRRALITILKRDTEAAVMADGLTWENALAKRAEARHAEEIERAGRMDWLWQVLP